MKKNINGKLYDTATALKIAYCYSEQLPTDLHYWKETLYKKKTGEFFLHGEGGPATKYAKSVGENQWRGSEKIIPISYENARNWAQKNLDAAKYKEIFGPITENDTKKAVTLYLQTNILAQAKRAAQKKNISLSAFFEMAVKETAKNANEKR